ERDRIARRHEQPEGAAVQDLAAGADVARDHRDTRGHGLDQRDAETFFAPGGEDERVELHQDAGDVPRYAEKADMLGDAAPGGHRFQTGAARAVADQPQLDRPAASLQFPAGAKERAVVLGMIDAADHARPPDRPLRASARGYGAAPKSMPIDAVIDDRGLRFVHGEPSQHPGADMVAAADQAVGHRTADPDLQPELAKRPAMPVPGIGPDVRRHPGHPGELRAPGDEGVP